MEYDDPDPTEKGHDLGLVVFNGGCGRVLMVDLDDEDAHEDHVERIDLLNRPECAQALLAGPSIKTVSKSGKGYHYYYLTQQVLTPYQRVLHQAFLGSDGKREVLALRRLNEGTEPCYLYETEDEAMRVRNWARLYNVQLEV
jgi:hypothetical protein